MDIVRLGHSSFRIRGRKATIVTDPFSPELTGVKFPKVEADIVTVSHDHKDHNFIEGVSGETVVVDGPGEYEIRGVKIIGISSYHDEEKGVKRGKNTIYHIEIDQITIAHLGDLGHKLSEEQTELLSGVDILMIPVGGIYTIDSSSAASIITALEPNITIPMHYFEQKLNSEHFGNLSGPDVFLKEIGKENIQPIAKLTVSKDKLSGEPTVVVLE